MHEVAISSPQIGPDPLTFTDVRVGTEGDDTNPGVGFPIKTQSSPSAHGLHNSPYVLAGQMQSKAVSDPSYNVVP